MYPYVSFDLYRGGIPKISTILVDWPQTPVAWLKVVEDNGSAVQQARYVWEILE